MHFDNWIFFVLVAVAMLFRWLSSAANKTREDDETQQRPTGVPRTPPSVRRAAPESDRDKIRKFLEALGQPTDTPPPPPVAPRTNVPPRPVAPVEPPRGMIPMPPRRPKKTPELPKPIQSPGQFIPTSFEPQNIDVESVELRIPEAKASAPPPLPSAVTTTPAFPVTLETPVPQPAAQGETDFKALLRSPAGLRNAMILREIFGPPRSLQPLEFV